MKRLVFLFVLFPLFLFGQNRRRGVIDSIRASTTNNLPNIFRILSNAPGTRAEPTSVTDSGDYITVVTRIYSPKPFFLKPLFTQPISRMKISPLSAVILDTVCIPPLPDFMPDPEPLSVMALLKLEIGAIPGINVHTIEIPPIPDPQLDDLPFFPVVLILVDISPVTLDTMMVPRLEQKKMPVEEMHLSPEGYSLLEKLEGFSPYLYSLKDGGFTIGFGFFLPYAEGDKWDKGVTWEEAEEMMREKMPAYEQQVKKYINVPLTQNEFDALTMLAYNLGGFARATSIVNDINMHADFDKLQSDWNRFVHSKAPNVTKGLMNRRKDEMRVRGESNYQPERKIMVLKNR